MNVMDFIRISPYINDCPNCKSDLIGNGAGTLEVLEDVIKRTCKCGFRFEYNVNNGTTRHKIKKAINNALQELEEAKYE